MEGVRIVRVWPDDNLDLGDLVRSSVAEGHRFVARAREEWDAGVNRFAAPGEGLFLARHGDGVVGMCGLNVDPYAGDPGVGRLRHLYVAPGRRRLGVGRALVVACLELAAGRFRRVRLRTENEDAARFYLGLGFSAVDEADTTHVIELA